MTVSFIIPVYNNIELTRKCLESLRETVRGIDYETIIVDDHSDSATFEFLNSLADSTTQVIRNARNRGYAYSNKVGARAAKGDYLFLVNNDLVFLPGWFEPMLRAVKRTKIGVVGNVQLDAVTGEIDHAGFLFDGLGRLRHKRTRNERAIFKPRYSSFNAVTGACIAIERMLYLELGGLNEAFENGCEDLDLCFKAHAKGLKTVVANQSIVKHFVSSTRGPSNLRDERNARLLQQTWGERISEIAARGWPRSYLSQVREDWRAFDWTLFKSAAIRLINNGMPPSHTGERIIEAKFARNERHWKSILDKQSDDMIKLSYAPKSDQWAGKHFVYSGLESNRNTLPGKWLKDTATVKTAPGIYVSSIRIIGNILPPGDEIETKGELGLKVTTNKTQIEAFYPLQPGPFDISIEELPTVPSEETSIKIDLLGVAKTNAYAYIGRVTRKWFILSRKLRHYWKQHIEQKKNQRLIVEKILLNNETLLDFKTSPHAPANFDFLRKYGNIGINLVGWFDAELGIGESVRLAAKSLDTTSIKTNCIPLKVNCLASRGDRSFDDRLVEVNSYSINVFHIDPAQCSDIDYHHGNHFRKHRKNIAYWAWELPEFPEKWIRYFQYFDEIWAPSNFTRDAISLKSPVPVITIPHCIQFPIIDKDYRELFDLPKDKFLFLFAYDLNSYQERKNPRAVIEAFKEAFGGQAQSDVGLVIKTHSADTNPAPFKELLEQLQGIENTYLINETMSRENLYGLMSTVDSYVSLHRSEGFGLTVAESMYLGKPVISTDWSATSEFLNASNGCPVRADLVGIEVAHGPYERGQIWSEPSIEHAAEYMRRLFSDGDYRNQIGKSAATDIRRRFSPEAIGRIYEQRLKAMSLWV